MKNAFPPSSHKNSKGGGEGEAILLRSNFNCQEKSSKWLLLLKNTHLFWIFFLLLFIHPKQVYSVAIRKYQSNFQIIKFHTLVGDSSPFSQLYNFTLLRIRFKDCLSSDVKETGRNLGCFWNSHLNLSLEVAFLIASFYFQRRTDLWGICHDFYSNLAMHSDTHRHGFHGEGNDIKSALWVQLALAQWVGKVSPSWSCEEVAV